MGAGWEAGEAIAGALTGGITAIGGLIQRKKEREQELQIANNTNDLNEQLTREQWARDDNAYQRAVHDAKKAGLSAFSVAGNAAGNSNAIPMESAKLNSSVSAGYADLVAALQPLMSIREQKLQNDKLVTETDALKAAENRAQEEHEYMMEELGFRSRVRNDSYQLERELSETQKKLNEVQADVSLKASEREEKMAELKRIEQSIENARNQARWHEEQNTIYSPENEEYRKVNYKQGLVVQRTGAQLDLDRRFLENKYQKILNEKAAMDNNYYSQKYNYEVRQLAVELTYLDEKAKQELKNLKKQGHNITADTISKIVGSGSNLANTINNILKGAGSSKNNIIDGALNLIGLFD